MRNAHGNRHFTRSGRRKLGGGLGRNQQDESGEILGIVVDIFGEYGASVDFGGATAGNRGEGFVAAGEHFANAAGGILRGSTLQFGIGEKEALALRQRDGVGGDRVKIGERGSGAANELVLDVQDGFRNHGEIAIQKEIENPDDRTRKRIFHRRQKGVRDVFADGAKGGVKSGAGHGGDSGAEEADGGGFAEGAGLALKGHTRFTRVQVHRCLRSAPSGILSASRWSKAMARMTTRPEPDEYAPHYGKYISLVQGNDIVAILEAQRLQTFQLFAARSERDGNFRYAPRKWTVKEVLGHVNDAERIFAYRALRIARGDKTPLAGFDQEPYVSVAAFTERPLADLAEEFAHVRSATLALFRHLKEEAWIRRGTASDNEVSVRALAFIIAGHELHHRCILDEHYFPAIPRA